VSFDWESEECETAFFTSLSSHSRRKFVAFWNMRKDWRIKAGDAISLCLDTLQATGVDEDNGELSAFWADVFVEGGDEYGPVEEWLVTLYRREHTWSSFLKDSPERLTMAVMDTRCLDFNDVAGFGRRCGQALSDPDGKLSSYLNGKHRSWSQGFPVLETSLFLNEEISKDLLEQGHLEIIEEKKGKCKWVATNLRKGTKFPLGDHGTLTVDEKPTPYYPPIMSWDPIISETIHEIQNVAFWETFMGDHPESHHEEYIRGIWKVQPLRVLILSYSAGKKSCS